MPHKIKGSSVQNHDSAQEDPFALVHATTGRQVFGRSVMEDATAYPLFLVFFLLLTFFLDLRTDFFLVTVVGL